MKTVAILGIIPVVLLVSGCASTDTTQLRQENLALASELAASKSMANDLETKNQKLNEELDSQRNIGNTLLEEKGQQKTDAAALRQATRSFLKKHMEAIRKFTTSSALLDYVGGELIGRDDIADSNVLLVDLQNRIPGDGALLEGRLLVKGKMEAAFCILRPEGDNLMVLWMGKPFSISQQGGATNTFDEIVVTQKGDVVGLYCPQAVQVPFSRGSGDTRLLPGRVKTGQVIPLRSLEEHGRRMYSFGMAGLL